MLIAIIPSSHHLLIWLDNIYLLLSRSKIKYCIRISFFFRH
nr:MAG TPA: hypothetical protein [Caudoviricetes sp.]